MMTELDYSIALDALRKAAKLFATAQDDYRARRIDDAAFLAARAAFEASQQAFDAAFARASEEREE